MTKQYKILSLLTLRLVQVLDVHPLGLDDLEDVEDGSEEQTPDDQSEEASLSREGCPEGDDDSHEGECADDQVEGVDNEPGQAVDVLPLKY